MMPIIAVLTDITCFKLEPIDFDTTVYYNQLVEIHNQNEFMTVKNPASLRLG
jgi:hypothetical protein